MWTCGNPLQLSSTSSTLMVQFSQIISLRVLEQLIETKGVREVMAALSAKGPHVSDAEEVEILSLRRLCSLQLSWIP